MLQHWVPVYLLFTWKHSQSKGSSQQHQSTSAPDSNPCRPPSWLCKPAFSRQLEEFLKDAFRKSKSQTIPAVGNTKCPNPHCCCFMHTWPFIEPGNVKQTVLKSELPSIAVGSNWTGLMLFSNLTERYFFFHRKWNLLLVGIYFLFSLTSCIFFHSWFHRMNSIRFWKLLYFPLGTT